MPLERGKKERGKGREEKKGARGISVSDRDEEYITIKIKLGTA